MKLNNKAVFWIYRGFMIAFMPLTPMLASPAGQRALAWGIPCVYLIVFITSAFRLINRPSKSGSWLRGYVFAVAWMLIAYGLVRAPHQVEKLHYLQYMGLFWISLRCFGSYPPVPRYSIALGFSLLVGACDEGVQNFLPGRYFDWGDIWLNYQGSLLGLVLAITLAQRRPEKS